MHPPGGQRARIGRWNAFDDKESIEEVVGGDVDGTISLVLWWRSPKKKPRGFKKNEKDDTHRRRANSKGKSEVANQFGNQIRVGDFSRSLLRGVIGSNK